MTITNLFGMVQRMTAALRDNLRRLLDERQLDMKELSLASGLGETAVRDIIVRGRNARASTILKLASALGVSAAELITGDGPTYQRIPLIGFTSGEGWSPFDKAGGQIFEELAMQVQGDAVALVVRDNSMSPVYREGDLVIGARRAKARPDNLVGLDCIVLTDTNARYVRMLLKGDAAGRFTLRSYDRQKDDIRNVKLKWVAPIEWVKRGGSQR